MIHPIKSDQPAGHRPIRTLAWLAAAALLFAGAAKAERLDKDLVEQFHKALILEDSSTDDSFEEALAYRRVNVKEAAAKVESLSDLSQALLLTDWPKVDNAEKRNPKPKSFEEGSRYLVTDVRKEMSDRFNEGIKNALRAGSGSSNARKIAVANLVGETIAKASDLGERVGDKDKNEIKKTRLVSDIDIGGYAKLLARMTDVPNERLDVAVAAALGEFREHPKVVGPALKRHLSNTHGEATHLAAAAALVKLSSSVSRKVPLKGSEPGVRRSDPRTFEPLTIDQTFDIFEVVTDAAAAGLRDSSVVVRRQCVVAMRNVAREVADPTFINALFTVDTLPPRERTKHSAKETAKIRAEHDALEKALERSDAVLVAYAKNYTGVLAEAVGDPDEMVRVDARKTLSAMAHFRLALRDLRAKIPAVPLETKGTPPGKKTPKDEDKDLSRRPSREGDTIRLVGGTNATRPVVLPPTPLRRLRQAPVAKSDVIANLVVKDDAALLLAGMRDPSEKVRRAAHETIEALGDDVAKFLPELAKSLEDKDLFVRWISARIVRKLATEDNRRNNRPHESAEIIIPALVKGLDDEDLDGRIAVTRALGAYGPDAKDAIPALAKLVGKGDAEYRVIVLKALAGIGEDSRSALPEIVAAFKADDPRVRGEAARLVGLLSKFSQSYVEDLEKLASDPDSRVRELAGAAILRIQPE